MPPKPGRGRPRKSAASTNVVAAPASPAAAAGKGRKGNKGRPSAATAVAALAASRGKDNNGAASPAAGGRKRRRAEEDEEDELQGIEGETEEEEEEVEEGEEGETEDEAGEEAIEEETEDEAEEEAVEEDNDDDDDEADELSELPSAVSVTANKDKKAGKRGSGATAAVGNGTKGKKRRSEAQMDDDSIGDATKTAKKPRTTAKTAKSAGEKEKERERERTQAVTSSKAKFAHLKPRTRHISQSVITTKWRPAPLPAQAAARALFVAAKRPVIEAAGRKSSTAGGGVMGDGYDKRKAEAEATLASVLRRLEKQIPRIPFPSMKGPAADAFELEKVVERNRGLEMQLTPAVHAVKLLKDAVGKEEKVLEREMEELDMLERRAREAERRGKERGKRGLHPVLKRFRAGDERIGGGGGREDSVDEIRMATTDRWRPETDGDEDVEAELEGDEQLAPVLEQLRGHLESMHANLEQVEGLDEAMNGARVTLDGVLRAKLGEERYEELVLSS
ncbi:hypothetical protein UCDDS831_g05590 [Diplodia seriata]|uniref:Kinetochore protein fta7 n=1 Tax=Diplodia seriata TaxID=420778 RepID=A0A0G2GQS1_9PEZI|nr:hypothetical protein UCDDS831_g05590 [Diplodia seriata]